MHPIRFALPSGRIIATDSCYLDRPGDMSPFVRTVPPGRYPVWLAPCALATNFFVLVEELDSVGLCVP